MKKLSKKPLQLSPTQVRVLSSDTLTSANGGFNAGATVQKPPGGAGMCWNVMGAHLPI